MNQQNNDLDENNFQRHHYQQKNMQYSDAAAYCSNRQNIESYAGGTSSGLAILLPNPIRHKAQQEEHLGQRLKLRKFGQSLNQAQRDNYTRENDKWSPLVYYFHYEQSNQGTQCSRLYMQEQFAKSQYSEETHIQFYQNGYLIDHFDFIEYNEEFKLQLRNMRIPQRLLRRYIYGQRLLFIIVDKTNKPLTWIPGAGKSLRSNHSQVINQKQAQQIRKESTDRNQQIIIDKKKPISNIQVRLINGQKLTLTVNQDTFLGQVHQYLQTFQQGQPFRLCSGFPPTPLNLETTISDNGLQQSLIIQR